ncbi:MAG: hypothetical protein AAFU64_01505, partial [Bacteroidota bacterium]
PKYSLIITYKNKKKISFCGQKFPSHFRSILDNMLMLDPHLKKLELVNQEYVFEIADDCP